MEEGSRQVTSELQSTEFSWKSDEWAQLFMQNGRPSEFSQMTSLLLA